MTTQLEKLKLKEAQLKARIQNLEAGQKTRERKKDMQRKILFGPTCYNGSKRATAWR